MIVHNFSSGPSILPQEVIHATADAVLNFNNTGLSLIEISHRTPAFVSILNETRALSLSLLGLKEETHTALFLSGGASMEFVRVAYNLLTTNETAGYVNTGNWSKNAIKEAGFFGNVIEIASSEAQGYTYIPKKYEVPDALKYIHITSNNTIYGTQYKEFPNTNLPLICDMSSDIFSRVLNFSQFDLIYAGAQKNIGTSGANLVIIKNSLLEKCNMQIPGIMSYIKHKEKDSLYNTPSVLAIYTCYLTLKWLKNLGGVKAIEKKNNAKAALMYSEIDKNELFFGNAAIEDRSVMNATFFLKDEKLSSKFDSLLLENGISGLKGHRVAGGYRASMYNALPYESVTTLVELMQYFENKQ